MTEPILTHEFKDQKFYFNSTPMAQALINEIFFDNYKVLEKGIEFGDGDIVLDIGACEGMFSIMIAKLFPQTRVIALEPVPRTYFQMMRNIGLNGCKNIEPYNVGVGKPGQDYGTLYVGRNDHSGGSSAWLTFDKEKQEQVVVALMSLDEVFEEYGINRCRLLKMDIEGAEFDVLYNSTILPRVDFMTAEYHINQRLTYSSRRMDALATWCSGQTKLIYVEMCKMGE